MLTRVNLNSPSGLITGAPGNIIATERKIRFRLPKQLKRLHRALLHIFAVNGSSAAIDGKTIVTKVVLEADGAEKFVIKPGMEDYIRGIDNTSGDSFSNSSIVLNFSSVFAAASPWGTGDSRDIDIVVYVQADTAATILTDVQGSIEYRTLKADEPRGAIIRSHFLREKPSTQGVGNQILDLPQGLLNFSHISRIIFDTQHIKAVRIRLADVLVFEGTPQRVQEYLENDPVLRVPANIGNRFPVIFDMGGRFGESLPLYDELGQKLPLVIEYDWDPAQAVADFDICVRGAEGVKAA